MPALCIAVIPDVLEALRTPRERKESLLDAACQDITARNIVDLELGFAAVMQCVLWVHGSSGAIETLCTYLDQQRMSYEVYETASYDTEDAPSKEDEKG